MKESAVPPRTPSEVLAEKVVNILEEKKLVLKSDAQKLAGDLASGKMKSEDWRVLIEKAIDKGTLDD